MVDEHDKQAESKRRAAPERRPPARDGRLADALRANLRRRKVQLRERRAAETTEKRQD
jgi:hypothetical protein